MKPHWPAPSPGSRPTLLVAAAAWAFAAAPLSAQTADRRLAVHGVDRTYRLHVPPGLPRDGTAALVLAFHGGGGDGAGMERLTGFSALADRAGFAVAYPDGIARNWNDGRDTSVSEAHRRRSDDLGFIAALIDTLVAEFTCDPRRVFATGISNGAIFSHYLAAHLAGRVAAIATVAGSIARPFAQEFAPSAPVSVFMIQGTRDPLVPYTGGGVARGRRGSVIGADTSARLWARRDGISAEPESGELPDTDPADGCRVRWQRWRGGTNGTEVWLYALEGGGHTWPGGPQYLPRLIVGRVCRDFDATFAIWDFFSRHARAGGAGGT